MFRNRLEGEDASRQSRSLHRFGPMSASCGSASGCSDCLGLNFQQVEGRREFACPAPTARLGSLPSSVRQPHSQQTASIAPRSSGESTIAPATGPIVNLWGRSPRTNRPATALGAAARVAALLALATTAAISQQYRSSAKRYRDCRCLCQQSTAAGSLFLAASSFRSNRRRCRAIRESGFAWERSA